MSTATAERYLRIVVEIAELDRQLECIDPGACEDAALKIAEPILAGIGELEIERDAISARKITTDHVYPPIPIRTMDWRAYYDGEEDGPHGEGSTEVEAVADLIANTEE